MPHTRLVPSFVLTQDRLKQLELLVPEVFEDGKVNWSALKEAMGDYLEADSGGLEHFGLFWPGRTDARRLATVASRGTLLPAGGDGVREAETKNLFIEGDNLEVLKLLQKAYAGRIKMIYIDPPYNTGNDFIYSDDFSEPLADYLRRTGQADERGALTTNKRAGGRFHANWLSMMLPRLVLARNLMREDGVLFVSIDEGEVAGLRYLLNEVFGEECFVGALTLLCNPKGRSQDKYFATNHEYVIVYSKTPLPTGSLAIEKDEQQLAEEYGEEDEGGLYRLLELRNTHREFGKHNRPNLFYPFYVADDGAVSVEPSDGSTKVLPLWDDGFQGCWTWEKGKAERDIGFLIGQKVKGQWKVYRKSYASGAERMLKTILIDKRYTTEQGQKVFNKLFETKSKLFQSPKSPFLLADLMRTSTSRSDVILDFFAGSGTTAQAVTMLNAEDGGQRRFILVQLPELSGSDSPAAKAGLTTIAEIGKERIRRVLKQFAKGEKKPKTDLGFRVFKLAASNFKIWQDYTGDSATQLQIFFDQSENPLVEGWTGAGLLTEVMLVEGFPLDSAVTTMSVVGENTIQVVTSPDRSHRLLVCLDKRIEDATVAALVFENLDVLVCLDTALSDQAKQRLADKCTLKTI